MPKEPGKRKRQQDNAHRSVAKRYMADPSAIPHPVGSLGRTRAERKANANRGAANTRTMYDVVATVPRVDFAMREAYGGGSLGTLHNTPVLRPKKNPSRKRKVVPQRITKGWAGPPPKRRVP
jgi:hypothetical protein